MSNNRVQIFDVDGSFITTLSSDLIYEKFERPHSITTLQNKIFVGDSPIYHVQLFDYSHIFPSFSSYVPDWIKKNAGWWAKDQITDYDFVKGIEFMIQEGIIKIKKIQADTELSDGIPSWIKNNAGWWSDGLISDDEFVKGVEYLIKSKIIKI